MHHPTDRITHTTAFVTPVVEHRLEREIAQWVPTYKVLWSTEPVSIVEISPLTTRYGWQTDSDS